MKKKKIVKENVKSQAKKYSYADLEKMEDDKCYEIIDGELYLMSSPVVAHQMMAAEIYAQLHAFLRDKKFTPFIAPLKVALSENEEEEIFDVVQPDVFVVCNKSKIGEKKISGAPDFVVEILSPDTVGYDMLTKLRLYQEYKVREYWIIDIENKMVLPYILNKRGVFEVSDKVYSLEESIPVKTLPGCVIELNAMDNERPAVEETKGIIKKEIKKEYKKEPKIQYKEENDNEEADPLLVTSSGAFQDVFLN